MSKLISKLIFKPLKFKIKIKMEKFGEPSRKDRHILKTIIKESVRNAESDEAKLKKNVSQANKDLNFNLITAYEVALHVNF